VCLSRSRAGAVVGHVGSDVQHIGDAFEWSGVGTDSTGQPHRPSINAAMVGEVGHLDFGMSGTERAGWDSRCPIMLAV
jgi:hypothetical protein